MCVGLCTLMGLANAVAFGGVVRCRRASDPLPAIPFLMGQCAGPLAVARQCAWQYKYICLLCIPHGAADQGSLIPLGSTTILPELYCAPSERLA